MNAVASPEPTEIDFAAPHLRECKQAEDAAKSARIAAEDALIALVGCKTEGGTTIKTEYFAVKTVGKLTRSLDVPAFESIKAQIPEAIRDRLVRYKAELSLTELRHIESNEPQIYAVLAQALTIKPAKASVSVDVLA